VLTSIFTWIGDNENVLSGLVAIVVLAGLVATGIRQIGARRKHARDQTRAAPAKPVPRTDKLIDQEIRYCQTTDGQRIAYAITGEGPPIIRLLGWFTHLEAEWRSPLGRSFWQRLSQNHQLIRYDGRGMGMSGAASEFSAQTRLLDFEAVIEAANLERFAILATSEGTRTALRYTAAHPERVSHLVLYGTNAYNNPSSDSDVSLAGKAYVSMIKSGWGKPTHQKLFADLFLGLSPSTAEKEYFMEMQQCSATQKVAVDYVRSMMESETGFEMASQIKVPTLLMHPKGDHICSFQASVELAAEIPGARLKPLEGDCHWLLMETEGSDYYIETIEAFLNEPSTPARNPS
jgi:pimeloyl-ACP methyl ester carboxylesterase